MSAQWKPGDVVVIRDINERRLGGVKTGTIKKVGRTLLQVERASGRVEAYRIDTGRRNDKYARSWLQTPEEYEADQERNAVALLGDHDRGEVDDRG